MARHNDPDLEARIFQAARKLWHQGGESALSMRAVAKAAGTNTPAVYRRFRTREDILRALVSSYQQQLYKILVRCKSPLEAAEAMLDFALAQPREYELIMSGLLARMTDERPNFELMSHRCAEWFGGSAKDHEGLVFALWSLVHGTASLTITGIVTRKDAARSRRAFRKYVETIVSRVEELRGL